MTLIVCLRGTDGMVLASDSRGTFGDPRGVTAQNDNQKKVYRLSKYSGMLIAGSGEIGTMVYNELGKEIEKMQDIGVTPMMDTVRFMLKSKFDEWFSPKKFQLQAISGIPVPARPDLAAIVGGYDVFEGKPRTPRIFTLLSSYDFAPMLHDYGFALQGIAQYALYLLNRLYRNDSSIANLVPLGAYVISETASQDGKVGGPIQMITITNEGSKELSAGEVEIVVKENERRREALRESFYGRS